MPRYCGQCGYDTTSVPVRPGGRLCPECGATTRGVRARGSLVRAVWWTCAPFAGCLAVGFVCFGLAVEINADASAIPFLAGVGAWGWGVIIGIAALVQTPARAARFWPREQVRPRVMAVVAAAIVLDLVVLAAALFAMTILLSTW